MFSVPSSAPTDKQTPVSGRTFRRKDGPALIQSGRTNRTRSGETFERSAPLTRDQAERMQSALATLTGFTDVEAIPTKHAAADGKTWFVRWHRVAVDPLPSQKSALREVRVERSIHQAPEMEAFLADDDPAIPRRWVLHNIPERGYSSLYLVSLDACTCPDWTNRHRDVKACKHMHFLIGHLAQQRRKRTQAERELDARLNGW